MKAAADSQGPIDHSSWAHHCKIAQITTELRIKILFQTIRMKGEKKDLQVISYLTRWGCLISSWFNLHRSFEGDVHWLRLGRGNSLQLQPKHNTQNQYRNTTYIHHKSILTRMNEHLLHYYTKQSLNFGVDKLKPLQIIILLYKYPNCK